MKKVVLILVAMIMACETFSQIEEFDVSTFKKHDASPQKANKEIFLDNSKYPISLTKVVKSGGYSQHYFGKDYRPYNLLGHNLYLAKDMSEDFYSGSGNRTIGDYPLLVLTLSTANDLKLEKASKGKYFEVVDVAVLEEEKASIYKKLQSSVSFSYDTIQYRESSEFGGLKKKTKIYNFTKNQAFSLFKVSSSRNGAIYTLKGDDDKFYFVPGLIIQDGVSRVEINDSKIKGNTGNRIKSQSPLLLGYSISIADFISVDSYDFYKNKYVGKELVSNSYIDYRNEDERKYKKDSELTYVAEKLSLKDGKMGLTIYNKAKDTRDLIFINGYDKMSAKASNSQIHKNDSIYILKGSGEYTYYLILRSEADSLRYKWEQEELQKEREKLAQDEVKRRELINKYGEKNAKYITEGKVCVGMNKEMCREAMGSPDNISKSTNALGEIEQWTYSLGYRYFHGLIPITIVTFVNGKVTSVDEVRDNSLL